MSRLRGMSPLLRRFTTALAALPLAIGVGLAPAHAAGAPAADPVKIPNTCRAAMTIVRPDNTLSLGVVQGRSGRLYSTGHQLGYKPKAIAYVGTRSNRGITIDRFFAVDADGRMHRISVIDRSGTTTPSVEVRDERVAGGWGGVRLMVASGPYLYVVTTSGAMRRYQITTAYGLTVAGTVSRSGWGSVRSLAYGGWWNLGKGRAAEDIVALTGKGAVKAYMIPRDKPGRFSTHTLATRGWGMFTHLAAGECSTGKSRSLAGVRGDGEVYVYLDVNGNDQSGKDIRWGGRAAIGWTGLAAD